MVKRIKLRRSKTRIGAGERGIALFMSLVMLLIITVLGLSSVQTTSMQERMARNSRDTNLAFQAAEAAIRDAEIAMSELNSIDVFTNAGANANGLYVEQAYLADPNWRQLDWSEENGAYVVAPTVISGVAAQPKYIIEFIKTVESFDDRLNLNNIGQDTGSGRTQIFRVTVYATGGSDTAHVMIQSTYGRRF